MDWLNVIVVIATIIGALYIFVAQAREGMRELKEEIREVKGEIRDVRTELDRTATKLEKKIDHLDQKLDAKYDKLEADIALVRKDVNRNTSHLSNIEGQITQLTRPNIIRIEREDIERKPLSGGAKKLRDMAN